MPAVANLIWETSVTGGNGPLVVTKVSGARRFSDAFTLGGTDAFYIYASNPTGDEWQLGSGHLSDADTIVWDTILQSSNNDNAVNFSAGLIDLTNDIPANKQVQTDAVQTLTNKTIPDYLDKAVYDPNSVEDDAFDQDNMVDGTTNKNFTATEKTKLAGIETAADVTDAANVAAAGAFMKASDDSDDITEGASKLLMTASERSKLSGIEALADVTDAGNVASSIHGVSGKTTPVDADEFGGIDSADSNSLKKFTWANIKATLKTYFDTLYQPLAAKLTAIAALTWASDKVMYFTGTGAVATADLPAYGRTLISQTSEANLKAAINAEAGVDFMAYDSHLFAGIPSASSNTTKTVSRNDCGKSILYFDDSNYTVTIPPASTGLWIYGDWFEIMKSVTGGTISIARGSGVTLIWLPTCVNADRSLANTTGASCTLRYLGSDIWAISGVGVS